MRKALAVVVTALLLGSSSLWAEEIAVTVAKITGKAQVQKGAEWVPLAVGQKLAPGDTVSTGFKSELQLKIGPSTVTVKALSRLVLQSLVQDGTSLKTDLYLKVGKVDAEVNKSEAVQSQKFQVASPVATASVRGTAFSFDGLNLQVTRGLVDFSDQRGNTVSIPVGEAARVALKANRQTIATNQRLVVEDSVVAAPAASEEEASVSWNGWSSSDLLALLYGYNWTGEGGWTQVYLGGIDPLPVPLLTFFTIGGITGIAPPSAVYLSVGGIDQVEPLSKTTITVGGIDP